MSSAKLTSQPSPSLDTMSRPKGSGRGRGSDRRRGRAGHGQSTPSVDDNSVNGQVAPVPAPDQVLKTAGSKKEAPVAPSMPGSQPSGLVQVQVNLRKRKSSATEKSKEDVLEVQEGPRSKVLRTVTNGGDQVASAEVSAVGSASTGREKSAPESKKRKRGPTEEEEEPVAKGSKSTINGRSHGKGAARTSVHSLALSLTVQDYRGFAPPTKPTGLKGALLHGSPKELTLAQIRARQAELGAFFRETGAAMVGRNKKRGDEALKALEAAPMKEVQSKNWYQKILQQLATNETKQMGRMERVREMEQKSIDTELTGMVEQQMMQCEVRQIVCSIGLFLSANTSVEISCGADGSLHPRFLAVRRPDAGPTGHRPCGSPDACSEDDRPGQHPGSIPVRFDCRLRGEGGKGQVLLRVPPDKEPNERRSLRPQVPPHSRNHSARGRLGGL